MSDSSTCKWLDRAGKDGPLRTGPSEKGSVLGGQKVENQGLWDQMKAKLGFPTDKLGNLGQAP